MKDSPGDLSRRSGWTRAEWALLAILAAMQFTHIIDFMIMMPLGPRYIRELPVTPGQFGALVAAYGFSAALSALVAASIIDRYDRKHAILFLYGGFTIGTLLCAVAGSFIPLLLARALAGAFGGLIGAVVLAIVGDVFPEERRGLATGVVMSAFSIATIAGVPTGLYLAQLFGTSAPFAAVGGLSLLLLAMAAVLLPPLRRHLEDPARERSSSILAVLSQPTHVRAYLLMITLVLTTFTVIPYLSTYLVANVGWREEHLSFVYLFGGAATLVTMSIFGRLSDRFGKLQVFRILAVLTMLPIVLLTNMPPSSMAWSLTVTTLFMILSSGRMVPALAMITASARPAYRGSFMSVISSVQQMSSGLASVVGGALLSQPVENGPLEGFPLIGLLSCLSCAVSLVLAGQVRRAPAEEPAELVDEPLPLPEPVQNLS